MRLLACERGFKAVLLLLLGLGILRFRGNKDAIQDAWNADIPLLRPFAEQIGWNIDGSFITRWAQDALGLSATALAWIAVAVFAYSALQATEAVGLWMVKRWGEYFAVVATSVFLPLEIHELLNKVTVLRVLALVVNVAAIVWLLWSKRSSASAAAVRRTTRSTPRRASSPSSAPPPASSRPGAAAQSRARARDRSLYPARMQMDVRAETPADSAEVRRVVAAAFADETVAALWEQLADGPGAASSVAVADGAIVGHVGLSRGWVDARDRLVEVHVLSPLSVLPAYKRRGVGRALVDAAIDVADAMGSPALFLEGDPRYYGRLGFEPAVPHGFTPPSRRVPPLGFQCALLSAYEPSLTGGVVYPDPFWVHDRVGVRGEMLDRFGL